MKESFIGFSSCRLRRVMMCAWRSSSSSASFECQARAIVSILLVIASVQQMLAIIYH